MRKFDTFGEYMFDLLFAPLKKGKRAVNQFYIFFKVIGRGFDDVKAAFLRVRDEANVASASPVMLPVHGQDRNMPRLEGETIEAYRTRLSMKGIISEWGGTKGGILYALAALGYEESYIEPVSFHDSERWAEFIVFLGGKYPSGVNDLDIIDAEVRKVKEGSSRPEYGLEEWNAVEIREWSLIGFYSFPICGRLRCGQHPGKNNNVGYLLRSQAGIYSSGHEGKFSYILCGTTRAQEPPYVKGDILAGHLLKAALELRTAYHEGQFGYILSGTTRLSQGENNGKAGLSQVELRTAYHEGQFSYILSGTTRAQEPPYIEGDVLDGQLSKAALELYTAYHEGQFGYILSGTTRLSKGEDNGKAGPSQVETVQEFVVGSASYPRSGQYRTGQRRKEVKP